MCSSDLLIQGSYLAALEAKIGFGLSDRQKRKLDQGREKAWSERLSEILVNSGVPDVEKLVKACKYEVTHAAIAAVKRGETVVRTECEDILDRLVDLIRNKLHTH